MQRFYSYMYNKVFFSETTQQFQEAGNLYLERFSKINVQYDLIYFRLFCSISISFYTGILQVVHRCRIQLYR